MNTFGTVFRCTTWGESHGEAIGCIIDGCPAGLELECSDIGKELERDVPDSDLGTPRKEPNEARVLSGIFEGRTIGTPICIAVFNTAQKSNDYEQFRHRYRPGHAEYTYHQRFGVYNHLGGGRASGRVYIAHLAAGAVARKLLSLKGIELQSKVEELGGVSCGSGDSEDRARQKCLEIGSAGDSSGGIVSLRIQGVPAGVGSPVFGKLHSSIMYAVSTIGGVKGVECGLGFEAARATGSTFNDPFCIRDGCIAPGGNNAGGVLGGISTGLDLYFRIAVKPTPSMEIPQRTVNWKTGEEETVSVKGRFDKNFAPRVGPLAEALAALVLVDQMILSGHIHPTRV